MAHAPGSQDRPVRAPVLVLAADDGPGMAAARDRGVEVRSFGPGQLPELALAVVHGCRAVATPEVDAARQVCRMVEVLDAATGEPPSREGA